MKNIERLKLCDYKDEHIWINVYASLTNNVLSISGQDLGETVMRCWGDDDYEYWYEFDRRGTAKLLRLIKGKKDPASALLREFSGPDGCRKMRELCDANAIKYKFFNYV